MIQDILGQPEAGRIGGYPDLKTAIETVDRNFTSVYKATILDGTTSPEQGNNYDAGLVSLSEVITPDTPDASLSKAVPWAAIIAGVVVVYFLMRG